MEQRVGEQSKERKRAAARSSVASHRSPVLGPNAMNRTNAMNAITHTVAGIRWFGNPIPKTQNREPKKGRKT
jgi:hypothetical protein